MFFRFTSISQSLFCVSLFCVRLCALFFWRERQLGFPDSPVSRLFPTLRLNVCAASCRSAFGHAATSIASPAALCRAAAVCFPRVLLRVRFSALAAPRIVSVWPRLRPRRFCSGSVVCDVVTGRKRRSSISTYSTCSHPAYLQKKKDTYMMGRGTQDGGAYPAGFTMT